MGRLVNFILYHFLNTYTWSIAIQKNTNFEFMATGKAVFNTVKLFGKNFLSRVIGGLNQLRRNQEIEKQYWFFN